MGRRGAGVLVALGVTMLAWGGPVFAQPQTTGMIMPPRPKGFDDYLRDLAGDDGPDRLLAARMLRNEVRIALRTVERRPAGSHLSDAAYSDLLLFDTQLAPVCMRALTVDNVAGICADILRSLELEASLPALEAARAQESRRRVRRRMERAIEQIERGMTSAQEPS